MTSHGQLGTHKTHHSLDSGEATTFPHVTFFVFACGTHIRMTFCSKLSQFGLSRLWELITPSSDLRLGWGLKQTCSSPKELSNGLSHFTYTHRGWVDSRLLVVRSQTASLTPSPSFDHNLCYKCLNGSCKAIFWHLHFETFPMV
jgi:hypothetical protein